MSNVPPAGPYGSPPPPPWQIQPAPGGFAPPPPPKKKSNTPKIVIGVVAVAVLAVVGVLVATRGDDKPSIASTSQTDESEQTDATDPATSDATVPAEVSTTTISSQPPANTLLLPPITTSLPNASTVPPTAPPATAAPATTVPFVLPPGAVDLGHQVYVPLADGYTDTKSDGGLDTFTSADGSAKVSIQVLARVLGESPATLMQEYVDSFTGGYDATNFTSSVRFTVSGPVPTNEYGTFYRTYNAADANADSVNGGLYVFQRADGLSALYDVFSSGTTMGLTDAAFQAFITSFSVAPLLGPTADLQDFPSFRPTTSIPNLAVSGILGFTPAPGFGQSTDPSGGTRVTSTTKDFTVNLIVGQPSADVAALTAQSFLNSEYANLTFSDIEVYEPFHDQTHLGIPWSGTYTDGNLVSGAIEIFWDPSTMNVIAITRDFYATGDGIEPEEPETDFMRESVLDDIVYGIPNP